MNLLPPATDVKKNAVTSLGKVWLQKSLAQPKESAHADIQPCLTLLKVNKTTTIKQATK